MPELTHANQIPWVVARKHAGLRAIVEGAARIQGERDKLEGWRLDQVRKAELALESAGAAYAGGQFSEKLLSAAVVALAASSTAQTVTDRVRFAGSGRMHSFLSNPNFAEDVRRFFADCATAVTELPPTMCAEEADRRHGTLTTWRMWATPERFPGVETVLPLLRAVFTDPMPPPSPVERLANAPIPAPRDPAPSVRKKIKAIFFPGPSDVDPVPSL